MHNLLLTSVEQLSQALVMVLVSLSASEMALVSLMASIVGRGQSRRVQPSHEELAEMIATLYCHGLLPGRSKQILHKALSALALLVSRINKLAYGVLLVVIPQIMEQEVTAQRVQELGLGVALERTSVTVERLREAVQRIADDPSSRTHAQAIHESGGYQQATNALMQFTRAHV